MNWNEIKLKTRLIGSRLGDTLDKIPVVVRAIAAILVLTFLFWGAISYNSWDAPPKVIVSIKGNPRTKIYHTPNCPNYARLTNFVKFETMERAEEQGYRMARNCK